MLTFLPPEWSGKRMVEFKKGRNLEKCTSKCVEVIRGETLRLSSIVVWRRDRKSGTVQRGKRASFPEK